MRVVVTGGAGFIGSRVVMTLLAQAADVVVVDSLRPDVHGDVPDLAGLTGASLVHADVRHRDAVAGALRDADVVVHLAAKVGLGVDLDDVEDYVSSNDLGTAVVLRAMRATGVRRLVYASSMVVYGEGAYDCPEHGRVAPAPRRVEDLAAGRFEPGCPRCARELTPQTVEETAPLDPRNVYAATKLHGEHLAACWARETDGTALALRFHNVYGPGMPRDTPYAGVAAVFRSSLVAGRAPQVFEDGGQRRDFVHVDDVAAAVAAAANASAGARSGARAYNIGSDRVATIGAVAAGLSAAMSGPEPRVTGEYRLGDVRHVTASSRRAREELGWQARVTLAEGLRDVAGSSLRG